MRRDSSGSVGKKATPAKRPDHPVMTEYVMPPLLEKRRGIDTCMIEEIYFSSALKGRGGQLDWVLALLHYYKFSKIIFVYHVAFCSI